MARWRSVARNNSRTSLLPTVLSRHTFDDCDLLHDIIVPAGTSKTFRKALHFTDGDTDFLVLEKPADNATVAPSAPQQEQKKGNKKQDAPKDKKQDKADKKQDKKAADKADKKQDKKAADKQEQKQEQK